MSVDQYSFDQFSSVPCVSFSSDSKRVALSPNNEEVYVFNYDGKTWTRSSVLKGHNGRVYSIDWSSQSGKIVTCGSDRNAFVWSEVNPDEWKPSLVVLRINRAAICNKWSPLGNKFAVGTGNKLIAICYYDGSNDWWISKHIRKPITSSVLSVDWHPNNNLVAAGSTDFAVRIFSAAIKETDKKPTTTNWGDKKNFGAVLCEFNSGQGGWIHSVKFNASGDQLCWVSHDSCVSVADATKGTDFVYVFRTQGLPLLSCVWTNDSSIVAAGHDNMPYLFKYEGGVVKLVKSLDEEKSGQSAKKEVSAMNKFKNLDKFAQTTTSTSVVNTVHKNTIKSLLVLPSGKVASCSLDEKVVIWNAV